jgi:hypothetical protein
MDDTMLKKKTLYGFGIMCVAVFTCLLAAHIVMGADHNDPNAVNSIFSDIPVSAADLYDVFGFPSDDKTGGEKVLVSLTFASVPRAGVFDNDMLYMININPTPRANLDWDENTPLETLLQYVEAVRAKYVQTKPGVIRVTFDKDNRANLDWVNFPGGDFSTTVDTNKVVTINGPDGSAIKTFIGGRDDPFFNDLPGFFRSINYAPQFYHVPHTASSDMRETHIPKTLIELEGNDLFNFDPKEPMLGQGVKKDLPPGPITWTGKKFKKDKKGNYRFVYSGKDARAGKNANAITFEIPLKYLTKSPDTDRIVNIWGESWVLKAAHKVSSIPDNEPPPASLWTRFTNWVSGLFSAKPPFDVNAYKRVDTVGVPFEDAALSEREDERQLGANNVKLASHFVERLGHLGWGFGPSISALGVGTCFDHSKSPVSVYKTYSNPVEAFPRVKKCLFQDMNMPDNSWNKSGKNIKLRKPFEVFVPDVCAVDMDTTGTWPFGRRLEDQVATRFLAVFLDMKKGCGGKPCNMETLNDPGLWQKLPIEPKTVPNPMKNDKEFLKDFPYLAEPWPEPQTYEPGNR